MIREIEASVPFEQGMEMYNNGVFQRLTIYVYNVPGPGQAVGPAQQASRGSLFKFVSVECAECGADLGIHSSHQASIPELPLM